MAKSRRKNPFFTAAESLKGDKQLTNRRLRHHVRQLLREAKDPDEIADDLPVDLWDVNHPSHMAKRNRREFDPRERPMLMRK